MGLATETVADLARRVERFVACDDFESALKAIADFMGEAYKMAAKKRKIGIGCSRVDMLCAAIGRAFSDRHPSVSRSQMDAGPSEAPESDLYVATHLYATGGHTAVIGDFRSAQPRVPARLIVTDNRRHGTTLASDILARAGFEQKDTLVITEATQTARLERVLKEVARRRWRRVYLFNHQTDSSAIAAVYNVPAERLVFVHHSDRLPSLGACLPGSHHVDLTPFTFHCCREHSAPASHLYLPICVADQGARDFSGQGTRRRVRVTATSGGRQKFRPPGYHLGPDYFETIAQVLAACDATHVHIGPLGTAELKSFYVTLERAGVDPARLIHVERVPSLWKAMSDYDVDLYICSFPDAGARASVEVLGSGTPAVWHVPNENLRYRSSHMKYPVAATWTEPKALVELIRQADMSWLMIQSTAARSYYERGHSIGVLAKALATLNGAEPDCPIAGTGPYDDVLSLDRLLDLRPFHRRLWRAFSLQRQPLARR